MGLGWLLLLASGVMATWEIDYLNAGDCGGIQIPLYAESDASSRACQAEQCTAIEHRFNANITCSDTWQSLGYEMTVFSDAQCTTEVLRASASLGKCMPLGQDYAVFQCNASIAMATLYDSDSCLGRPLDVVQLDVTGKCLPEGDKNEYTIARCSR